MLFTDKNQVRDESWFKNNLDITDSIIDWYITQANSIILSYIWIIYDVSKFTGSLFTWSQTENLLNRIETLLASWYLLQKEYWIEARNTDKDGYQKERDAVDILQKISEWEIRLFDINFNEFPKKSWSPTWALQMTTPSDNPNLDPTFTTNMKF